MKALICRANTDDLAELHLENWRLPALAANQVRIRVRAASVNFPDLLMVRGLYQHKPELPFVVGGEFAGEVTQTGEAVRSVSVGSRVIAAGLAGAFAEEAQVPAASVRPVPDGIDFRAAAAFTTAYLTAQVALVCRGALQKGEWLLVHGAAGGVGLAAVDLGLRLGAEVIATASTEEKRAFLKSYGAPHVLPASGFPNIVRELTDQHGADVVFDPVGGDVFDESVRCVAFNGRLLVVGFASGRIPAVAANLPLIKGFSVVGVRAGEYGRQFPERGRENLAAIDRLLARGAIRPHIGARFPLDRAVDAMRLLAERKAIGKAIIEP